MIRKAKRERDREQGRYG